MSQESFAKTKPVVDVGLGIQAKHTGQAAKSTQPTPAAASIQDALAGALPGWDLLPAAPFIRRVK